MDNEYNRYYIKIQTILGINPKTIYEELATALGPNAPAYRTVAKWVTRFHEGREDVNDEPRFGCPPRSNNQIVRSYKNPTFDHI